MVFAIASCGAETGLGFGSCPEGLNVQGLTLKGNACAIGQVPATARRSDHLCRVMHPDVIGLP